jgi:hypothetical protein
MVKCRSLYQITYFCKHPKPIHNKAFYSIQKTKVQ